MSYNNWVGVDLDGTLAHYDEWKGIEHIGEPIQPMMARVNQWVSKGIIVKIFTARASLPEQIPFIHDWLEKHGLPRFEVTNVKDFAMLELWDDRCVQVVSNTGVPISERCSTGRDET
jgi:hypothetical protein